MTISENEEFALSDREMLIVLVRLMRLVGANLQNANSARRKAWGKHLLEDWKSLQLLAERSQDDANRHD